MDSETEFFFFFAPWKQIFFYTIFIRTDSRADYGGVLFAEFNLGLSIVQRTVNDDPLRNQCRSAVCRLCLSDNYSENVLTYNKKKKKNAFKTGKAYRDEILVVKFKFDRNRKQTKNNLISPGQFDLFKNVPLYF